MFCVPGTVVCRDDVVSVKRRVEDEGELELESASQSAGAVLLSRRMCIVEWAGDVVLHHIRGVNLFFFFCTGGLLEKKYLIALAEIVPL